VLPALAVLSLDLWVVVPEGRNVALHQRYEVRIHDDPGRQPPHTWAPGRAVAGHKTKGNTKVVALKVVDHVHALHPSLKGSRDQPSV